MKNLLIAYSMKQLWLMLLWTFVWWVFCGHKFSIHSDNQACGFSAIWEYYIHPHEKLPVLAWFLLPLAKPSWGRKDFICLTFPHHSPPIRAITIGTWKQKPKQRETLGKCCLGTCSPGLPLPSYAAQDPYLRLAPLRVGWALPHQLTIKTMPHRHVHKPAWWRHFLSCGSLFLGLSSWQPRLTITQPNQKWPLPFFVVVVIVSTYNKWETLIHILANIYSPGILAILRSAPWYLS